MNVTIIKGEHHDQQLKKAYAYIIEIAKREGVLKLETFEGQRN